MTAPPVNSVSPMKRPFYRLVRYLLNTRYVREQLWRSGRDLFCQERPAHLPPLWTPAPFRNPAPPAAPGNRPVFITARFRSGSTFLWLVFRNIPGVTAYYEPLNPNRWFSPTAPRKVDPSHKRVTDYGAEYHGMPDLDRWFHDDWSSRYLYMDRTHHDPDLRRYVEELIARADGRAVLQFNRVDFRLDWLRANFPEAQILHLYRDPRALWMSMQRTEGFRVPLDCRLSLETALPELPFYTLPWAMDLRSVFPFLEPEGATHPYALHYYLWRLSYSFGRQYADHSVAYEALMEDFPGAFGEIAKVLDLPGVDLKALRELVHAGEGVTWPDYAPGEWFDAIEAECEGVLAAYFRDRTHEEARPPRGG